MWTKQVTEFSTRIFFLLTNQAKLVCLVWPEHWLFFFVFAVRLENKFQTTVSTIIMVASIQYLKLCWWVIFASSFTKFNSPLLQVVLLEILKLSATVLRLKCKPPSFDKASVKASFKFLLPSVIYAVNNNIYLGRNHLPVIIWDDRVN